MDSMGEFLFTARGASSLCHVPAGRGIAAIASHDQRPRKLVLPAFQFPVENGVKRQESLPEMTDTLR